MNSFSRWLRATLCFTAAAAAPAHLAAQGELIPSPDGYVHVIAPMQWRGLGFRGIGLAPCAAFAGHPLQVTGKAYHPSGIRRVTVNGAEIPLTTDRNGLAGFNTRLSADAAVLPVEIIAYPIAGAPIVRRHRCAAVGQDSHPEPAAAGGGYSEVVSNEVSLPVGLGSLPLPARAAVVATLQRDPGIVIADRATRLDVRARADTYLVVGADGSIRHRVSAPTAAAGAAALAAVLRREYGTLQVEKLRPPAATFPLSFSFGTPPVFALGTPISFRARSDRAGYLTVVDLGTDAQIQVLYPLPREGVGQVGAGQEVTLPSAALIAAAAPDRPYPASPPTGVGMVRAFVTPRPLVLPDPAEGPVSADVLLTALREAISGGEPWSTVALSYRIVP